MSLFTTIPGGFPNQSTTDSGDTSQALHNEMTETFTAKQRLTTTTKFQHDILVQFDSLVYIIVGYQFVKYGHSACLLPLLCHLAIQKLLSSTLVISQARSTLWLSLYDDSISEEVRDTFRRIVISTTCLAIYWKTIFTCMYHTIFIWWWMVPLADHGNLSKIQYGSWWVISFIGELPPSDIPFDSGLASKLVALGLPQLLVSDMVILFLQLVLYQCIYRQSRTFDETVPNGDSQYFIRNTRDINSMALSSFGTNDRFVVKIKLFESFRKDSYISQPE
jgi:hypothetical protein